MKKILSKEKFLFAKHAQKKMLREPIKAALMSYISDRRFIIVPRFVPQSLLLFLYSCFCSSSSLICSDNMVYISPIHVVNTRPMFLRWCIVMRVSQMYHLKAAFRCWKHLLSAYFAKNIVCATEFGRFWNSTAISVFVSTSDVPSPRLRLCLKPLALAPKIAP